MRRERAPGVMAFNGYAFQHRDHPIPVKAGERIRIYVVNAGPTLATSFHVIGDMFDTWNVEGQTGRDSQAISLGPAQGGWVDLTLRQPGVYPFVDHDFAGMAQGAEGALVTDGAPAGDASHF